MEQRFLKPYRHLSRAALADFKAVASAGTDAKMAATTTTTTPTATTTATTAPAATALSKDTTDVYERASALADLYWSYLEAQNERTRSWYGQAALAAEAGHLSGGCADAPEAPAGTAERVGAGEIGHVFSPGASGIRTVPIACSLLKIRSDQRATKEVSSLCVI